MTAPHFETIMNTDLLNQTLTLPNGTVLRNRRNDEWGGGLENRPQGWRSS